MSRPASGSSTSDPPPDVTRIVQPVITTDLGFFARLPVHSPPVVAASDGHYREEQCRAVLESLFPGHHFPSCRPSWLVNPRTGRSLELDGYNEELRLAFEYNGEQHYVYPNKFHRSPDEFLDYKRRDLIKRLLCDQHGVYLLVIPYTVPVVSLRSYIQEYLPSTQARRALELTT